MAVYQEAVFAVVFVISALTTPSYSQGACDVEVGKCIGQLISTTAAGIQGLPLAFRSCGKYQEAADCLDAIKGDSCQSQVTQLKDIAKDLLVDSPLCGKKDEADKYSKCWTNPKLADPQMCEKGGIVNPEDPDAVCKNLLTTVNCYTEKTKMECGQKQSDLVNLVMKVMSKNIGKTMGKDCPELEVSSSTVNTGSSLLMSLLMICVGVFAFN